METQQLLRDQTVFPTEEVLASALGSSYAAFEKFVATVSGSEYGLVPEWNYYKDGKSWLCKVCNKKRTVFWLSAWDGFFKVSFFFTEKNMEGIAALAIDGRIKEDFCRSKPIGRLIPLLINIDSGENLADVLRLVEYKKSLK